MAKLARESYPNLAELALRDVVLGQEISNAFLEIDHWRRADEEEDQAYGVEMAED